MKTLKHGDVSLALQMEREYTINIFLGILTKRKFCFYYRAILSCQQCFA